MEVTEPTRRSSTLPPPRLDAAVNGTRGLQRFDLARVLPAPKPAKLPTQKPIVQATVKMAVPESVRRLPHAPVAAPAFAPIAVSAPAVLRAPRSPWAALEAPFWAMVACASLVYASSLTSALVYVLLFR